ncbi:hypothetical protein BpHYR1_001471 [Brachionus plicatilis]|uniref:Uncharacterized protein n=1 Tax=Brachionus plicatilis TaxID=10195 RepID=A0A3M7PSM1_BRAPC|nr:hypothetical protein BpHYR1_001471 [Brachionus plicatilis]
MICVKEFFFVLNYTPWFFFSTGYKRNFIIKKLELYSSQSLYCLFINHCSFFINSPFINELIEFIIQTHFQLVYMMFTFGA